MIVLLGGVIISVSAITGMMTAYSQTAVQNSTSVSSAAIAANSSAIK